MCGGRRELTSKASHILNISNQNEEIFHVEQQTDGYGKDIWQFCT
jgi:hypothetical protein